MAYPIRFHYLLSSWIFVLSCLYPFHKISTFPLNILASVGCFEVILNPYNEHWIKNAYILALHIAPFFWIPWIISETTLQFAAIVVIIYLLFTAAIQKSCFDIYSILLKERHKGVSEFIGDRFGLNTSLV
jgi:hypothetical protein